MHSKAPTLERHDLLLILLLGVAAVAGNSFPLPLMFGVDLLLGSAFVFALLLHYGLPAALLVALPAYGATWLTWNQPYSFYLFLAELLLLAGLLRRFPQRELPLLTSALWVPGLALLTLFYYRLTLGLEWPDTWLVTLKQGINSILNATLAVVIGPVLARLMPNRRQRMFSAHEILFYVPSLLVVAITMLLLFTLSQVQLQQLRGEFTARLLESRDYRLEHTRQSLAQLERELAGMERHCLASLDASDPAGCVPRLLDFSAWDQVFVRFPDAADWQQYSVQGSSGHASMPEALRTTPPQSGFMLDAGHQLYHFRRHGNDPAVWLGARVDLRHWSQAFWGAPPVPGSGKAGGTAVIWY